MARINEQERLNELTKREREFWNAGIYPGRHGMRSAAARLRGRCNVLCNTAE